MISKRLRNFYKCRMGGALASKYRVGKIFTSIAWEEHWRPKLTKISQVSYGRSTGVKISKVDENFTSILWEEHWRPKPIKAKKTQPLLKRTTCLADKTNHPVKRAESQ